MQRISVVSSNIRSIGYDEKTQTLEVEFKNYSVYQYPSFPEDLYTEFMNSDSKGKFFFSEIKYSYSFRRIS